jgi:hypothetical protein
VTFEELFNNPDYRALVERRRTLRALKQRAADWKNLYEELESRYLKELTEAELALDKVERGFELSSVATTGMAEALESQLADVKDTIATLRRELKLNRLRRLNGEYGEERYIENRKKLCAAFKNELSNEAWVIDLLALSRKSAKPSGEDKPVPAVAVRKPVKPKQILLDAEPKKEYKLDELQLGEPSHAFSKEKPAPAPKPISEKPSLDKTSVITDEMIGSAPLRMLEAALRIQKGDEWERHPLGRKDINIGNIRNPENEIGLYDTQSSRRHAKVIYDAVTESWFFVDLGSTNGSSINGKPAMPNDPVQLRNNDVVMVGDTKMLVYIP